HVWDLAAGSSGRSFAQALCGMAEKAPMFCIAQLIAAGVFDRFPALQFYFAETNASWLPSALYFMDGNYERLRGWFNVQLPRLPSEYIADHVYFGIVRDPLAIEYHEQLPMNRIMWGSDFPHDGCTFLKSREFLTDAFAKVEPKLREEVVLTNPATFYG